MHSFYLQLLPAVKSKIQNTAKFVLPKLVCKMNKDKEKFFFKKNKNKEGKALNEKLKMDCISNQSSGSVM